jgi:hypothetical protein
LFLKTDGAGNLSFDSLSFATPLAVIGNATAGSEIRLPEDTDNGSNYVAIKAPDTIASNLTLTLPSADGSSGQVLQTNGSGVLSFGTVGGKVLQVVQVFKTDTFTVSVANGSYADITGLSVSITPSSASNKILVFAKVDGGSDSSSSRPQYYRLLRGATVIGNGVDSGNRLGNSFSGFSVSGITRTMGSSSINFLDSPATTSSITYKIQVSHEVDATPTVYINRGQLDDDSTQTKRGSSIITLMEIAG